MYPFGAVVIVGLFDELMKLSSLVLAVNISANVLNFGHLGVLNRNNNPRIAADFQVTVVYKLS
jgi:hypothetical protein